MDLVLQVWGGAFYLINKMLFAFSEGKKGRVKKTLKMNGWIIYILGVPAWVIILVGHQNWIAASIEAGGIPAMILGLYNTYYDNQRQHKWFNYTVAICTYSSLVFGLLYSVLTHGGITSLSQVLEVGVMLGFLLGSYAIAKDKAIGWFFFMLMNLSMGALMLLQGKPILMLQQLVSFSFVFYAYIQSRPKKSARKVNAN